MVLARETGRNSRCVDEESDTRTDDPSDPSVTGAGEQIRGRYSGRYSGGKSRYGVKKAEDQLVVARLVKEARPRRYRRYRQGRARAGPTREARLEKKGEGEDGWWCDLELSSPPPPSGRRQVVQADKEPKSLTNFLASYSNSPTIAFFCPRKFTSDKSAKRCERGTRLLVTTYWAMLPISLLAESLV